MNASKVVACFVPMLAVAMLGCGGSSKGPNHPDDATKTEEAAEDVKEEAEDAADEVEDAAEDTAEEAEEAAEDAADEVEDATD